MLRRRVFKFNAVRLELQVISSTSMSPTFVAGHVPPDFCSTCNDILWLAEIHEGSNTTADGGNQLQECKLGLLNLFLSAPFLFCCCLILVLLPVAREDRSCPGSVCLPFNLTTRPEEDILCRSASGHLGPITVHQP
jgi:signal peptidase I